MAREEWPSVVLTIPASEGGVLAELYREGEVVAREDCGSSIRVTVRLPEEVLGRLRSRDGVAILEAPSAA
jgi:hypothetical protein